MLWLSTLRVRGKLMYDDVVKIYCRSRRRQQISRMKCYPKMMKVSRVRTGIHYAAMNISKIFATNPTQNIFDGRVECDTHADTFVARRNCLLMQYSERVCDVMPYSDDYKPKTGIPIVQVATVYTAANGQRTILIFNEALWMPEMENLLMNPNQLRHFGVEVQDNPYHPNPMVIQKDDEDECFVACLKSTSTNIYIETWTPTDEDLESYQRVTLTSPNVWNPYEIRFPGISEIEIGEIEGRNIKAVESHLMRELDDVGTEYDDVFKKPMRIDISVFNACIIGYSDNYCRRANS